MERIESAERQRDVALASLEALRKRFEAVEGERDVLQAQAQAKGEDHGLQDAANQLRAQLEQQQTRMEILTAECDRAHQVCEQASHWRSDVCMSHSR